MLTHSLTVAPLDRFVAAVRDVLAGSDPAVVATSHSVEPADLADAVRLYHAAGLAALQDQQASGWSQIRVEFPDWVETETLGAIRLGPSLDDLQERGALDRWWFLRKYPCWRIRLRCADVGAVKHTLDTLTSAGTIARWWPSIYEPELASFGGTVGIDIAHDLFCADSRGVLDYLRHEHNSLGRRELSLILLGGLLHGAELDVFERGDVFDRVARMRPMPSSTDNGRLDQLANKMSVLLHVHDHSDLLTPDGAAALAAPWLAAFQHAGKRLGGAATDGQLERGIRAILSHVIIFHWNRLGLSATTQGILARAATTALLPRN